jgi:hypothetical protein
VNQFQKKIQQDDTPVGIFLEVKEGISFTLKKTYDLID